MERKKAWTILIYANGNNELQPEMWQSKMAAENCGAHKDVNVLLQISKEKDDLVKIIRPSYSSSLFNIKWIGTRRYLVDNGKSNLIKDLGRINMANPISLYEFIKWAVTCYPANNYMLILSGHGYQFVGAMTDYSQNAPFIMGIPEICTAIERACRQTNTKIDLIVFDICYFNSVEVMYELGKTEDPVVKNVLTYLLNGPIAGLAWDKIIQIVQANYQSDLKYVISELTQTANKRDYNLLAIEINHFKLERLKELYCNLASCHLQRTSLINLAELHGSNATFSPHTVVSEIASNIASLVMCHTENLASDAKLLFVANSPTTDQNKLVVYSKLAFTKNNAWKHLLNLTKECVQPKAFDSQQLNPTELTLGEVYTYISIMNPALSTKQKQTILQSLIDYKKWTKPPI